MLEFLFVISLVLRPPRVLSILLRGYLGSLGNYPEALLGHLGPDKRIYYSFLVALVVQRLPINLVCRWPSPAFSPEPPWRTPSVGIVH